MKKLAGILLIFFCFGFILTGCTVEEEPTSTEEGNKYYFYYVDSNQTKLERMSYSPEKETQEFMISDLMGLFNEKEISLAGKHLLPEEVRMDSYEITDHVLKITFNNAYSKMSLAREILVRAGIVKTFVQVPGITGVKFLVGKNELMDTKGEPVGQMNAGTFVEASVDDKDSYRYDTFTLYFTDKDGKNLVEETRKVYYKRSIPKARVALEQLSKGPMEKNHYPTIPENTQLLNVTIEDNIGYVDFDHMFVDYALTGVEENIPIYSVVNTLINATGVEKVELFVDGKCDATFRENMNLYNFYKWNEEIITGKETEG